MRAPQVERPAELEEVVGQKRLAERVTGILSRIEEELDHVDTRIGESMHVLDADNDGLVPPAPALLAPRMSAGLACCALCCSCCKQGA